MSGGSSNTKPRRQQPSARVRPCSDGVRAAKLGLNGPCQKTTGPFTTPERVSEPGEWSRQACAEPDLVSTTHNKHNRTEPLSLRRAAGPATGELGSAIEAYGRPKTYIIHPLPAPGNRGVSQEPWCIVSDGHGGDQHDNQRATWARWLSMDNCRPSQAKASG